jgi:hypothetical protein
LGTGALGSNTIGLNNVAVGSGALAANTQGSSNTAIGAGALAINTSGAGNTAVGDHTITSIATGDNNTAFGAGALQHNALGINNTALGRSSLGGSTSGGGNVAVGYFAGATATGPRLSIFIGNEGLAADTETIKIGVQGEQTSAFIGGIRGITTGQNNAVAVLIDSQGQLGTVSSSRRYKDDIQPMADPGAALMKLRPVSFRYKKPFANGSTPLQYGLIAEEVADVMPYLAVFNDKGQPETVKYHELPTFLLAGWQAQQKTIAAQADEIAALKKRVAATERLEARLARIEATLPQTKAAALRQ